MNLLLKPFSEMTPQDYADLGMKAGLEIHQQLLTEKKLFCHCPAGKYNKEYDAEILRHMRPTLSASALIPPRCQITTTENTPVARQPMIKTFSSDWGPVQAPIAMRNLTSPAPSRPIE